MKLAVSDFSSSPEYLVDQHAGEDADEDPNDGEAEHGPETGVDGPVDHLAVGGGSEHVAKSGWKKMNHVIKVMVVSRPPPQPPYIRSLHQVQFSLWFSLYFITRNWWTEGVI